MPITTLARSAVLLVFIGILGLPLSSQAEPEPDDQHESAARVASVVLSVTKTAVQTDANKTAAAPEKRSGFIDLNGYYDSRRASGVTINLLANLPASLQYFSLTNYVNPNGASHLRDQEAFYTEQNLRWSPLRSVPIALTTQWVVRSGDQNDALRLGALWKISKTPGLRKAFSAVGLYVHTNAHAVQLDFIEDSGWRGQLEHVYKLKPFSDGVASRFYLAGFLDHNLAFGGSDGNPRSRIVTEHQLGARVIGNLHLVAEARYNQFLSEDRIGIAAGVQLLMPFQLTP